MATLIKLTFKPSFDNICFPAMANKFELSLKKNRFQSSRLYELYNIARMPSNTFHVYNGGTEAHYTVIDYGYY